jgi:hypothetical protein
MPHEIKQEPNGPVVAERGSRRGGPRTSQGKARVRFNAVKTGIFAKVVLSADSFRESQKDFWKLLDELREATRPRDRFEEILVENLALQFFRLARVYQADAEAAPLLFRSVREKFESDGFAASAEAVLKEEPFGSGRLPAADLLIRYEAGIWRQIDRIMDRLDGWRRIREGNPVLKAKGRTDD